MGHTIVGSCKELNGKLYIENKDMAMTVIMSLMEDFDIFFDELKML